jgi:hypothetical protein
MIDALEDILADVSNLLFELGLELQITLRQFSLQVKKLTHFVGMYLPTYMIALKAPFALNF